MQQQITNHGNDHTVRIRGVPVLGPDHPSSSKLLGEKNLNLGALSLRVLSSWYLHALQHRQQIERREVGRVSTTTVGLGRKFHDFIGLNG